MWMGMFEKLVQYKKQHTNTMVPKRYNEDPKLGSWVTEQRRYYKNDELNPNRVDLLNPINFTWEGVKERKKGRKIDNEKWMEMFQKLVGYKKQHKNTIVSRYYKNDSKLGQWVNTQRIEYKKDELNPNRVNLLNSVGFEWAGVVRGKIDNEKWIGMFQKLEAYKEMYRNTLVPHRYEEDPKLGHWVDRQRKTYKNDQLLPNRADLLNSIGSEWHGSNEKNLQLWMGMFQKLVAYKEQHKNTMVPSRYDKNPKLGRWVATQRKIYKKDELDLNRVDLLNSIDFN